MWRRLFWLSPLVIGLACTGLYLEHGNAYPCDFSDGPGVRDEVCQPGDVCGSDDVCRRYIYEGPRFEAGVGLTVPEYGPGTAQGKVLHPLFLNTRVQQIARDITKGGSTFVAIDAGFFELDKLGQLREVALPPLPPTPLPPETSFFTDVRGKRKVLVSFPTRLLIADLGANTPNQVTGTNFRTAIVPEFYVDAGTPLTIATPVVWTGSTTSLLREQAGRTWDLEQIPGVGGGYDDVIALPTMRAQWLALRRGDTVELRTLDGGQPADLALDPVTNPDGGVVTGAQGTMRTDVGGRVVTIERGGVLTTLQVLSSAAGLTLTRAWPDCRPCEDAAEVELLSPTTASGTVRVELACVRRIPRVRKALVVTGSVARSQVDGCTTQPIELLPQLRVTNFAIGRSQSGLLLGGAHGEVWMGESISTLQPAYLDRVPLDVAPASVGNLSLTAALTEDYVAVQQASQLTLNNGFRRIAPREVGLDDSARLGGFVHGVPNWGVSSEGLLLNLTIGQGLSPDRFGPTLVRASGEPITQTLGGEGVQLGDGGLIFFLAADDSLYQVSNPELTERPLDEDLLTPDLTPEPSVPIRSLALERTPLSTEGGRGRGYLVTSRNVYSWALSGTPARFSSTPMVLSAGEPLEVWFDSSRSALGRVGFSDGQIYTLPGGFALAPRLPASEAGVPAQVLDYENLGGWPVAYATTGIFVAGWDMVDGKLQNRFPDGGINRPMDWRELTLPDGSKPWMRLNRKETRPGRLFVSAEPRQAADAGGPYAGTQPFRLLLFLDDQVLEIAQHLRK